MVPLGAPTLAKMVIENMRTIPPNSATSPVGSGIPMYTCEYSHDFGCEHRAHNVTRNANAENPQKLTAGGNDP